MLKLAYTMPCGYSFIVVGCCHAEPLRRVRKPEDQPSGTEADASIRRAVAVDAVSNVAANEVSGLWGEVESLERGWVQAALWLAVVAIALALGFMLGAVWESKRADWLPPACATHGGAYDPSRDGCSFPLETQESRGDRFDRPGLG